MDLLADGPEDAPIHLLLAHGAGAPMDSASMNAVTTALATLRGDVSEDDARRIYSVMAQLDLPVWNDILADPDLLEKALRDTVHHRDGKQRLPLPIGIGRHRFVNDVSPAELRDAALLLRDNATEMAVTPVLDPAGIGR
jgi:2-epi-5-epi-valiolone synthase